MSFFNASSFANPQSRLMAVGVNLNSRNAITDAQGQVLAYAQTGGMMSPKRIELRSGARIFRFGTASRTAQGVAAGAWWIEQREFETVLNFAQTHGLAIGAAMRYLLLVPPEWSDATLLIRARVVRDLLAWRGLGNTVITPAKDGGMVHMPHENDNAARRVHQLFIPGLNAPGAASSALALEADYPLSAADSLRGFLYL